MIQNSEFKADVFPASISPLGNDGNEEVWQWHTGRVFLWAHMCAQLMEFSQIAKGLTGRNKHLYKIPHNSMVFTASSVAIIAD